MQLLNYCQNKSNPRRCKSFIMTQHAIFLTGRRTYFSENLSVLFWCVSNRLSPLWYVSVRISHVCQRRLNVLNRIYVLYPMRLKHVNDANMRTIAKLIEHNSHLCVWYANSSSRICKLGYRNALWRIQMYSPRPISMH